MSSCVGCVIKDISQGGALVAIRGDAFVPDRFYLWHDEIETMVECEVRWRRLNLVGLRFIDGDLRTVRAFVNCCLPEAGSVVIPFRRHRPA